MADSGDRSPDMVERRSGKEAAAERPEWLPEGWTMETMKTTTTESGIEDDDDDGDDDVVCFVDPSTGSRFYSKDEVLQFIQVKNPLDPTNKEDDAAAQKVGTDAKPIREVGELTEITEGKLKGFVKEVKYRTSRGKLKKDTRPAAENEPESAGKETKRCLFPVETPASKARKIEIDDTPKGSLVPTSDQPSPQGAEQADSVNKASSNPEHLGKESYGKPPLGLKLTVDDAGFGGREFPKISEIETIPVAEGIAPSEEVPKNLKTLEQSQPRKRGRKPKRGSRKAKAAIEVNQTAQPKRRKTKAARDISIPRRTSERLAALRAKKVAHAGPAGQSSDEKFMVSNQPGANSSENFNPDSESILVSAKQKGLDIITGLEIPKKLESEKNLGKEASLEKPVIGVESPKKLKSEELLDKEAEEPLAKRAASEKTIADTGNPENLENKELMGKEAKGPFAKDAISEKLIKGVDIPGKLENQELLGKAAMVPPAKQTIVEMSIIGRPILEKLKSQGLVGEAAAVKPLAMEAASKQPIIGTGIPQDKLESKELLGLAAAVKPMVIKLAPAKLITGLGIPGDKLENKELLLKSKELPGKAAVKPLANKATPEKALTGIKVPGNLKSTELLGKEPIPGKQIEQSAPAADTPAQSLTSPFGHLWPDPCIEFAFKTLTGDIPLDASAAFADYFNHQGDTNKKVSLNSAASAQNNTKSTSDDKHVDQQGSSGKQ
uniref:MBD domain-containing protein n=1 Tax=Ananas comosus var. bracteatus TaxID=296719 RepID=A0A6V7PZU6_ANACO|nr:unnamed protein product [Ananas comosus var. bracteatus]